MSDPTKPTDGTFMPDEAGESAPGNGAANRSPERAAQLAMRPELPRRFYKEAKTGQTDGGFAILLDGRPLKTPGRNALELPSASAAELVAGEWQRAGERIDPARMPVTRIVNSAIDGVSSRHGEVFADIVQFAGSDLLCYRASFPEGLVEAQKRHWDPLLAWLEAEAGARLVPVAGIMHLEQDEAAIAAFASALAATAGLEASATGPVAVAPAAILRLACLHSFTSLTGSAIIALALGAGSIGVDEAWAAAHVEEDWNIAQWGSDAIAEARRASRETEIRAAHSLLRTLD